MSADHATLLFLIVLFVSAEVYRLSRGMSGKVVSVVDTGLPGLGLPVTKVEVLLNRGDRVVADLSCCTACFCRLQVGDQVQVRHSNDGYVVELSWLRQRSCAATAGSRNQ
ncbi:MAG: hypothetical protein AB1646_07290 [Thermodesulfobacteriota bacterium]